MDTTERMMIMGMCLQGLLANSSRTATVKLEAGGMRPFTEDERMAQRQANVREAHQYADLLDPPPQMTDAHRIRSLARIAYTALIAADAEGAGKWVDFETACTSADEEDQARVEGVFERTSRWFHDTVGYPETVQDRIIQAVVAASVEGL